MKKIFIFLFFSLILEANEIYVDQEIKLMWQNNSDVGTVKKAWLVGDNCMKCCLYGNQQSCANSSGDTAMSYCQNLQLGNYNDWRLPNLVELNFLRQDPSNPFDFNKYAYWSATSALYKGKAREAAYILKGDSSLTRDKNHEYFIICVRGESNVSKEISEKFDNRLLDESM
ncbi:MAG: DUF1566 domain-containing protein [Campylobacterota bacterium]|nr:DUF1566 domain-containing protein [Campylobacterota bacterium]